MKLCCTIGALLSLAASAAGADTLDTISVPEGFVVERAAGPELSSYPMFMEFDETGNLFIAESTGLDLSGQEMAADPKCLILRLTDDNGDGLYDRKTVFAEELSLPMGVLWHQDALYVASPPDFVRFRDTDHDGVADEREVLLTGWNVFNTASLHGPFLGPDGRLYLTHGRHGYKITTKEGETLEGLASRIWRCQPDGTQLERFAGGGFDNPVELVFMPGGQLVGTMTYFTDPKLGQRDALMHWVWGGVYPKPHESTAEFIRTGSLMPVMSKYARIAPAGLLQYQASSFGEDYTGSLFSAQFNPHRVQRHQVVADGATYRTEDEDFLISSSPDFYPTDVLEDADGSILVSDTGGWYVDACPISRVAKPDVRGSIYRIRKKDAPAAIDPWGGRIDFEQVDNAQLAALLEDPRFRVRTRALEVLLRRGPESAEPFRRVIAKSQSTPAKLLALSGLFRLNPEGDAAPFVEALHDTDAEVRSLAARLLGDMGGEAAVSGLSSQLRAESPAERMAAATALGQIGDAAGVPALLEASAKSADRFEEHAIIYALIELGEQESLRAALNSDAPWPTRKAALIALDQLGDQQLAAEQVLPFLESGDPGLRADALWVASRHSDWADAVLDFVEARLRSGSADDAERAALQEILLAYAATDAGETRIAALLSDEKAVASVRQLMLTCIESAAGGSLSAAWREALEDGLHSADADIRAGAIRVIQARGFDGFGKDLNAIAGDKTESDMLRLAALAVIAQEDGALSDARITFAADRLSPGGDALVRRAASSVLTAAALDTPTLLALIETQLPQADPLALSTVLACVVRGSDAAAGDALVAALQEHTNVLDLLSMTQIENALKGYPEETRQRAAALESQMAQRAEGSVQRLLALTPRLGTGDVGRGRELFFSEKAQCSQCHAVGEDGGHLGPDLTTIGLVRSAHDLIESVLFPSASMVPDFVPYQIDLEFETYVGIILQQTADTITIAPGVNEVRHIPRSDVRNMQPAAVSIMPEGLDAAFTDEELIDLLTFLQSLNNEPWLIPQHWEGKAGHH
ncbi:MAG: c-type cytochrome [Candidatus Hydrogenedens sp.]|nr:c-type cytochrome [Candidatus Hydrogenedens sp.]